MKRTKPVVACLLLSLLAACSSSQGTGSSTNDSVVVGGLLGNAFREEPVTQNDADRVLADLVRTETGGALTGTDRQAAATALYRALSASTPGKTIAWENRSSGASGDVIAGPVYQVNNVVCRDYTHVVRIGEREDAVRGSACREDGGGWQPIV